MPNFCTHCGFYVKGLGRKPMGAGVLALVILTFPFSIVYLICRLATTGQPIRCPKCGIPVPL